MTRFIKTFLLWLLIFMSFTTTALAWKYRVLGETGDGYIVRDEWGDCYEFEPFGFIAPREGDVLISPNSFPDYGGLGPFINPRTGRGVRGFMEPLD